MITAKGSNITFTEFDRPRTAADMSKFAEEVVKKTKASPAKPKAIKAKPKPKPKAKAAKSPKKSPKAAKSPKAKVVKSKK
jgi:hypothetical protein